MDQSKRRIVQFLEKEIKTYTALSLFLTKNGIKEHVRVGEKRVLISPSFYKERVKEAKKLASNSENQSSNHPRPALLPCVGQMVRSLGGDSYSPCCCAPAVRSHTPVLTHEEIVDLVWADELRPLLVKRFPGSHGRPTEGGPRLCLWRRRHPGSWLLSVWQRRIQQPGALRSQR